MTFVAAICGLPRLGPPRFGMVRIKAEDLDDATVEAHRIANFDHPTKNGFVAYDVMVYPARDIPGTPVPYQDVQRADAVEFSPDLDRLDFARKKRSRWHALEPD